MKLFDRSVDLAQFNEESPLYPICRLWLKNRPYNRESTSGEKSPSPERESHSEDEVCNNPHIAFVSVQKYSANIYIQELYIFYNISSTYNSTSILKNTTVFGNVNVTCFYSQYTKVWVL